MKKSILTLFIVLGAIFNTQAQTSENYIKLKGHIQNAEEKVTVRVIEQQSEDQWTIVDRDIKKNNYVVTLNPTSNYQIWFTDENGYTKIMFHKGGDEGRWSLQLDVDFNLAHYCEVYQEDKDEYALRVYNPKEEGISYNKED